MKTYQDEVRKTVLEIDDPSNVNENTIPGVEAFTAHYLDSPSCQSCHPTAYRQWQASLHSHAWETLVARGADADPECIKCHSVGFGKSGGYLRPLQGQRLVNVGCENCHGPGSRHVEKHQKGLALAAKMKPVGEGTCRTCHYGEFSRPFDWEKFWPLVEHGHEEKTKTHIIENASI